MSKITAYNSIYSGRSIYPEETSKKTWFHKQHVGETDPTHSNKIVRKVYYYKNTANVDNEGKILSKITTISVDAAETAVGGIKFGTVENGFLKLDESHRICKSRFEFKSFVGEILVKVSLKLNCLTTPHN